MSAPEHSINQFDNGSPLEDSYDLDFPINLTGASVSFVYRTPEADENTVRSAVISDYEGTLTVATGATFRRNMIAADVDVAGVYIYEWVLTLANGVKIIRPASAPTTEFPNRTRPCFEVVASISTGSEEEEAQFMSANRLLVVATIAALKAVPEPVNDDYGMAMVQSDENGEVATFEFDATIVADDAPTEYVITEGGGGWRRKGL